MPDASTKVPTRTTTSTTVLVTRGGGEDLEVRVWPPAGVWTVAGGLEREGLLWEPAFKDESGLPGSLLVRRPEGFSDVELADLVRVLAWPGVMTLGYLPPGSRGECRRLPGAEPRDHGRVVFVELHEHADTLAWQLRAYGTAAALRRCAEAVGDLATGRTRAPTRTRSLVRRIPDRAGVVHSLVERLDAAGLDGHVRVLRSQPVRRAATA